MAKKKVKVKKRKKSMTKSAMLSHLAEVNEISKKVVVSFLDSLIALVYKEAPKNGVIIPGLGKLLIVHRKARMGRNPATGESIKISARKALKFRIAKAAKDTLAPRPKKKANKKNKKNKKK